MAIGMTRREQGALIGVALLIAAGLGVEGWRRMKPESAVIYVPGQGRWEKLADFKAGQRPQPLAMGIPTTSTIAIANPQGTSKAANPPAGGIDLNRAGPEELDRLPGVGPPTAAAIIETRTRLGGFNSVEQLDGVPGIGPKKLERIRPYVWVEKTDRKTTVAAAAVPVSLSEPKAAPKGGEPPAAKTAMPAPVVDVNAAGAEELQDVHGIGEVLARRIVEDRKLNGPYRRAGDLMRVQGIGPVNLKKMLPQIVVGPGRR